MVKSKIRSFIKEEQGATLFEYLAILSVISVVIYAIGPLFKKFMVGTEENPGFVDRLFTQSTEGLNDANKGLRVYDGCDPHITNVKAYDCDQL